MDWKQLAASLVASLAWPAAAVALGVLARPLMRGVLERVQSLRYGALEAGLRTLDALEAGPTSASVEPPPGSLPPDRSFAVLLETAPSATIESAWRRLRDVVLRAAQHASDDRSLSMTEALEVLLRRGTFGTRDLFIFNALGSIREAVYYQGSPLTPAAATAFIEHAEQLLSKAEKPHPVASG